MVGWEIDDVLPAENAANYIDPKLLDGSIGSVMGFLLAISAGIGSGILAAILGDFVGAGMGLVIEDFSGTEAGQ